MARAPNRPRAPRWDRRRDDMLISMRSRGTPDERIAQSLCRPLSEIARRVDELRAQGFEVRRRTPADRPKPRRRPEHAGPLNSSEIEVVRELRGQKLSCGAIAAHLGRGHAPVRAIVIIVDGELHHV